MIHESIDLVPAVAKVLAMAIGAASVAAVASFVYRWYSRSSIPEGVAVLLGVSVVALALNTTATLQDSVAADELISGTAAGYTLVAFAAGAIAADAGRRFGERLAVDVPGVDSVRTMESDVGSLVRAAGRVLRVHVPESIDDIDGYEPVPAGVKADLAGTTFLFPRRMTVAELTDRFVERLTRDYEIGHVDVEFADDGTIEYLAVGRRLAGIGQTLAPGTVAVAIHADPAFSATPGDRVQIWRPTAGSATDSGAESSDDGAAPELVTTGELRAAIGDVATIALDEGDVDRLADDVRYRIATLPAAVQADREFASLLRSADETMGSVTIEAGSDLDGNRVETVELTVAALEDDADVTAIPAGDRLLRPGETIYVVGRPDGIRRLEARASGERTDESSRTSSPSLEPRTPDADDD
ncbi:TrkA-C domain-containing protein [Salinarchaeum sp. Harcht-Bsk1]|uniref:TrkA-C domain-containing protein n=1 Tax=Salinarchaeum sp. Harcht-Bsk1 TaxID=1333523 RepID=UPI0003423439|nr:TrkA-C domain-containing protein [Salinarchaeum sp. Harcht-Bsk1]AGN00452.1 TrkA-C domain-containing protein [Salinarchaeum sp. Harcht-Bsk1]